MRIYIKRLILIILVAFSFALGQIITDEYMYSITLDNTEYSLGDTIKVNLQMTNISDDTINFVAFGWFDLLLIDSIGTVIDGIAFIPIDNYFTINPGDCLTDLWIYPLGVGTWDQLNYGVYHWLMKPFYNYETNDWDTASFHYRENLEIDHHVKTYAENYKLNNPYPNPFNPISNLDFSLANDAMIQIDVYDIRGKLLENLKSGYLTRGKYYISWDAKNYSAGVYFYKVTDNQTTQIKKILLLK